MLTAAVTGAAAGRGSLVLMAGPAGIGKTTLLRAACATAPRGAQLLTARGLALEGGFSYGIVRQLLEPVRAGAAPLADRARRDLLATGARPRRTALTGPDALTSAERRVAGLAADGMSNRQIAQHLFITLPTVETHLRHAFAKLGITSRTSLPAELAGRARTSSG